ncbi:MAG: hypothetical protein AMJ62_04055 [Myxococcales bacterium SG8_38]|nr:MAG: hypothetical protein AMJ62_04055 [Myxococcales bacterium SG8_38]
MQEGLVTALLWLLFGGTHVGLTMPPLRRRMSNALGEAGFVVLYSVIAIATFAALVHYVALHRWDEPQAALLVTIPPVRGALFGLSVAGFSLFIAAVLVYPRLPMATFRHRVTPVRGIQQITRHPFFSGIAIWAAAHSLLAPSQVTFVFFIGVVALAFVGAIHQDRRLIAELGEPYRAYVAATSFWPLVAVLTKRQRIRWREQPWLAYGVGIGASLGLYQVHDHIFDHGGVYVIGVVSLGSILAIVSSRFRAG